MAEQLPPPKSITAEHQLELTQLVADLTTVIGPGWFGIKTFDLLAERLYDRGVRSRLHAPEPFECPHCGQRFAALENDADGKQRIPFHKVLFMTDTMTCRGSRERVVPNESVQKLLQTCARCAAEGQGDAVPAVGKSPRGWPRCAACLYNDGHDDAQDGWHGEIGGYRGPALFPKSETCPRCQLGSPCRYHAMPGVRPPELNQVSDGDGPVVSERILVHGDGRRETVRLTQLEVKTYLRHGWTRAPAGGELHAPVWAMQQMSEVPGHVDRAPAAVDRPLPEGVQRVIRFVQQTRAHNWSSGDRVSAFVGVPDQGCQIVLGDLEAVLAEIPDAAPRYPTMWAYEQSCRTIRERDARIEKALELATQDIPGPAAGEADAVLAEVITALRLRMPSTEPATEEEKSEVTRALELAELPCAGEVLAPDAAISALETLAAEVRHLRVLGDTLVADVDRLEGETAAPRCPSCEHLVSGHYEDGSGCAVTIRDVIDCEDPHCPCTFDARSKQKVIDGE